MYKNLKFLGVLGFAAALSPWANALTYVDDFESSTAGWNIYFLDRSAGDCSGNINYQQYYGATPAGQAAGPQVYNGDTYLNVYSIYDQYTDGGLCRTVKVYKEQALRATDAGTHSFTFDATAPLGSEAQYAAASGVPVTAFVEIKENGGSYTTFVTEELSTVGDGQKSFNFTIPSERANSGHLISYGFKVIADHPTTNGNTLTTGRWYNDIYIRPVAYNAIDRDPNAIPVMPVGALLGLMALVGWMGWRRKAL